MFIVFWCKTVIEAYCELGESLGKMELWTADCFKLKVAASERVAERQPSLKAVSRDAVVRSVVMTPSW